MPLTALGALALEPAQSPIDRRNGERINLVQAYVALGVLPEEALGEVRARIAEDPGFLPPGVRLEFGGDADARADTVNSLMATLAMVVVLTLATLVLSFGSFRLTAITLVVAVLSMGLAILALAVFRYPFGINALIGVIGSIGVSINAAIIVLSALKEDPRAMAGDRAAMRDVVVGAGRHIVSTTVTTVGGFLPLILAGGVVLAALRDGGGRRRGAVDGGQLLLHAADVPPDDAPAPGAGGGRADGLTAVSPRPAAPGRRW